MNPGLFNALVRHQLLIEGLKKGQARKFDIVSFRMEREISRQLSLIGAIDLNAIPKTKMLTIAAAFRRSLYLILNPYAAEQERWLAEFVAADRAMLIQAFAAHSPFSAQAFAQALDAPKLFASSLATPMGANGKTPKVFLSDARAMAAVEIDAQVMKSWANNDKKADLEKKLIGTSDANHKDGVFEKVRRNTKAVTNTVMQQMTVNANEAVAKTQFKKYEWVSVLDDKTTAICRTRDGKEFEYGKGPLPPAHVNCRSTVIPVGLGGGQVDYMQTFSKWADAQPDTVLKDIFGDSKPDPANVKPLTLEQFKAKRKTTTDPN